MLVSDHRGLTAVTDAVLGEGMVGRDRSLGFMSCALDGDALAALVVGRGHGVTPDVSWLVQGRVGQEGSCRAEI